MVLVKFNWLPSTAIETTKTNAFLNFIIEKGNLDKVHHHVKNHYEV